MDEVSMSVFLSASGAASKRTKCVRVSCELYDNGSRERTYLFILLWRNVDVQTCQIIRNASYHLQQTRRNIPERGQLVFNSTADVLLHRMLKILVPLQCVVGRDELPLTAVFTEERHRLIDLALQTLDPVRRQNYLGILLAAFGVQVEHLLVQLLARFEEPFQQCHLLKPFWLFIAFFLRLVWV